MGKADIRRRLVGLIADVGPLRSWCAPKYARKVRKEVRTKSGYRSSGYHVGYHGIRCVMVREDVVRTAVRAKTATESPTESADGSRGYRNGHLRDVRIPGGFSMR